MTIALGLIFTALLMAALWMAANEPSEALSLVRQVDPDQTDESAWDLMGWHSFG